MSATNYILVLSRRYPSLQAYTHSDPTNYGAVTMVVGTKPDQAEMDAYWPSVESELNQASSLETKTRSMQKQYDLQTQVIETMRAIINSDTTTIQAMVDYWDLL